MRLQNQQFIYLFGLIPILVLFYLVVWRKKKEALEKLAQSPLLDRLLINYRPSYDKAKILVFITAVFFLVTALVGPQWGFTWQQVSHRGIDIAIAVDTSRSMLAQDVAPDRLHRSKLLIEDLIKGLEGDRVGLISFAGTSFLQVPLTVDYGSFMDGVQSLSPDIMPQGGTAIGEALENAQRAFENSGAENKVLILISDGENHQGNPVELATELKEMGVKLIVIGMGTTNGELIPVNRDGKRSYLKDKEGNLVQSRLDQKLLKEIGKSSGGIYLSGAQLTELQPIYNKYIRGLKKSEFSTTRKKNYHLHYQLFLLMGILLLVIEMMIGRRRGRDED